MNRRAAALVVGATAALAIGALVWWSIAGRRATDTPAGEEPLPADGVEMTGAELYFPNTAGWLGAESRQLPAASSADERARTGGGGAARRTDRAGARGALWAKGSSWPHST